MDLGDASSVFGGDLSQPIVELGEDVKDLGPGRQAEAGAVAAAAGTRCIIESSGRRRTRTDPTPG